MRIMEGRFFEGYLNLFKLNSNSDILTGKTNHETYIQDEFWKNFCNMQKKKILSIPLK